MISNKNLIIVGTIALTISFAFGRYSAPTKTEIKTVEVEKKTEKEKTDTDTSKHVGTKITEIVKPDGTKETTTTIIEDASTHTEATSDKTDDITKTVDKVVERTAPGVTLSFLGGATIANPYTPVYGAQISKQVLGPISLGVWGLTSKVVGVSIGVSF